MKTPLVRVYDKYNKGDKPKSLSWLWLTLSIGMFLLIILGILGCVKAVAETVGTSVTVGAYVEATCSNTNCVVTHWSNGLVWLPLF